MLLRVSLFLLLCLGVPSFAFAQTGIMGTSQFTLTHADNCRGDATIATLARLGNRCYQLDKNIEYYCQNPSAGGASLARCDQTSEWSRMFKTYSHATDCRGNVTDGELDDLCFNIASGELWACADLDAGGSATACDHNDDWVPIGTTGVVSIQSAFNNGNTINTADASRKFRVGTADTYLEIWADGTTLHQQVTPAQDYGVTINTGNEFNLFANDGSTLRFSVSEAGALNVTGLTSATGAFPVSNLGLSFAESDTNPGCAAGDFRIYADLSENKLKKCMNGVVSDL